MRRSRDLHSNGKQPPAITGDKMYPIACNDTVLDQKFPNLDERVLWLNIPMEEAVLVHEGDSLHHLEHDVADLGLRNGPTSLKATRRQWLG